MVMSTILQLFLNVVQFFFLWKMWVATDWNYRPICYALATLCICANLGSYLFINILQRHLDEEIHDVLGIKNHHVPEGKEVLYKIF